jgi:hypothetical protein
MQPSLPLIDYVFFILFLFSYVDLRPQNKNLSFLLVMLEKHIYLISKIAFVALLQSAMALQWGDIIECAMAKFHPARVMDGIHGLGKAG